MISLKHLSTKRNGTKWQKNKTTTFFSDLKRFSQKFCKFKQFFHFFFFLSKLKWNEMKKWEKLTWNYSPTKRIWIKLVFFFLFQMEFDWLDFGSGKKNKFESQQKITILFKLLRTQFIDSPSNLLDLPTNFSMSFISMKEKFSTTANSVIFRSLLARWFQIFKRFISVRGRMIYITVISIFSHQFYWTFQKW